MPSTILNENNWGDANEVAIWLPPGYDTSDQQYPVVYLLNGREATYRHFLGDQDVSAPVEVQRLPGEGRIEAPP
jgi:predicted alpha/beta superfamily hydrolase